MDKRSNASDHNLCHFSFSDGRRCRMLRHREHPGLCPFHSREERQRIESERIGTELAATLTGDCLTATDINHVLGKVFTALAQDRISIKKAKALCYAAQLMLASLPTVRREYQFKYSFEAWQTMQKNATHLPAPLDPIEDEFVADDNAPARHAENVGVGFSPSPTAAGSASLGVGTSAPTNQTVQSTHLSSPHPLAGSASAYGNSSSETNEDATEEPVLAGAGSTNRCGS